MYSINQLAKGISNPSLAARTIEKNIKNQIKKRKKHDFGIQGSYETGNIGDKALGKQFRYQIQQAGYRAETFNKDTNSSNAPNRIIGGGGVLHDWYGVEHLKRRLDYANGGDQGFIIGVGVPGFQSTEARNMISKVLPQMNMITVRDEWSKKNIKDVCNVDVTVTACPVFLYEDPDMETNGKTGVNFRPYFDQPDKPDHVLSDYFGYTDLEDANNRYIENIKKICDSIDDPIFIPFHYKDEEFAREHLDIPIHNYEFSVFETLKNVSEVERMVTTRYHSLVFAAICGKPVSTLAYEPKVEAVAERLSVPTYKPHKNISLDFHPISNIDNLRSAAKKNFEFLNENKYT